MLTSTVMAFNIALAKTMSEYDPSFKEALGLLKEIFRFDYMGSSEFEWGAVPKALSAIAENVNAYVAFDTRVNYKYKHYQIGKDNEEFVGTGTVHVICRVADREDVVEKIKAFASDAWNQSTKERVLLDEVLSGSSKYNDDLAGWLELDNGYLFFTDNDMYKKTCHLFGI